MVAGRPPHEPTDKTRGEVAALVSFGVKQEDIAMHLGISDVTLREYYREEINTATTRANAKVASKLYKKAVEQEDLGAITFWLKTRGKWREKDKQDSDQIDAVVDKLINALFEVKS